MCLLLQVEGIPCPCLENVIGHTAICFRICFQLLAKKHLLEDVLPLTKWRDDDKSPKPPK
jgi:hypothetical protein